MELQIEAVVGNVEKVTDFVNEQLENMNCSMRAITQVDIALDELFSNICRYAYGDRIGHAIIRVCKVPNMRSVQISLEDEGLPFNPLKVKEPDTTLGIHEREIGGLGIFLVRKIMDDVAYRYENGKNILTITKSF
ncbi:MAG: ATP-binding protein [Coriobacteriales bacterium]|nr:ATP-binding protein [Coriobacteriales bacterium]